MAVTKNLVLGGSGLIGTALCRHLESIGEEVINIDLRNGPEWDLRTMDLEPYSHVDYVWFLAWDVGGAKFLTAEKNLLNILHNNTILCERVFSFLEKTEIPFMFATTQLADANNTYGITKILGQEWTKLLGGKMARFWNVYGWEIPNERSHVIPDLVVQAMENKHIKLMTDGEEERQFLHIDDCAWNLVKLREIDVQDADMTTGKWYKIKELAAIIADRLDATWEPGDKVGYQNKMPANNIPVEFKFDYDLDSGLEEVIGHGKAFMAGKSL